MELHNSFVVEAPIADVWDAFLEPDRVAPCFPGATLTESDDTSFAGTVKVKLGPIAMLYRGTGVYVDTDESTRTAVIRANGKDSRGNGQANATVTMTLAETTPTSTTVAVATDLSITGKPAQLGRGIITEVAGKIIGQFATCLGQRLGAEADAVDAARAEMPVPVMAGVGVTNGAVLGVEARTAVPTPSPRRDYPPTPEAINLLDSRGGAVARRVAPVAVGAALGGFVVWLITRKP